ncbi:MAG: hypothetical protein KHW59_04545 [Clostridiales bacterium]|nr:hypothetical protein [Clostridiales bacterium]
MENAASKRLRRSDGRIGGTAAKKTRSWDAASLAPFHCNSAHEVGAGRFSQGTGSYFLRKSPPLWALTFGALFLLGRRKAAERMVQAMTLIKALEKVRDEAPRNMQVWVTICSLFGEEFEPRTMKIEHLMQDITMRFCIYEERFPDGNPKRTRDDCRWKVGEKIPYHDMPGYEQHIYRMTPEMDVIWIWVSPKRED